MTFAKRVIRMKQGESARLSQAEIDGSPVAIVAEHLDLKAERETQEIGPPRASSLYSACIRMHVLGSWYNMSKTQYGGFSQKLIYGIGNAVHWWIQNRPDMLGNRRVGWWRCLACGKIRYFGRPPKTNCEHCGARRGATEYFEHPLELKGSYPVTGHPDMFFEKFAKVFRVVEIKTMEGGAFDKLKAPLVEHEWQIQTYMWGCSKDPTIPVDIDPDVGYVMYFSKKDFQKQLPVKMFLVKRNEVVLEHIQGRLKAYKEGLENFPEKLPPPIESCVRMKFNSYRANTCPVKDLCMNH